jgi:hypothetical protein
VLPIGSDVINSRPNGPIPQEKVEAVARSELRYTLQGSASGVTRHTEPSTEDGQRAERVQSSSQRRHACCPPLHGALGAPL